jgi:hypothetical protein
MCSLLHRNPDPATRVQLPLDCCRQNPFHPLTAVGQNDRYEYIQRLYSERTRRKDPPLVKKSRLEEAEVAEVMNEVKTKKRKAKNKNAKYRPSSGQARTSYNPDKKVESRQNTVATTAMRSAKRIHPIRTFEIGCWSSTFLRDKIHPVTGEFYTKSDKAPLIARIGEVVSLLKKIRALSEKLVVMLIDHVSSTGQDQNVLASITTSESGKADSKTAGRGFWQAILRLVLGTSRNSSVIPAVVKIRELVERNNDGELVDFNIPRIKGIRRAVEMLSITMDNDMGNQVTGKIEFLVSKAKEVLEEQHHAVVDQIMRDKQMGDLLKFVTLNRMLPEPSRWHEVPISSLRQSFVSLTEECLFDLLYDFK